ncbi:unnamed protein product [Arabidopsis halleri]
MTATELLDSQDGVPEIFSDLVGREFEFEIKITDYNFRSEYETFTVSRYVEIQHPPPELKTNGKAPAGCYEDGMTLETVTGTPIPYDVANDLKGGY